MAMCKNVGPADRVVRAILGIGAIVVAFAALHVTEGAVAGLVVAGVGVVLLLTAAVAMCPLYIPIKLSTCRKPS